MGSPTALSLAAIKQRLELRSADALEFVIGPIAELRLVEPNAGGIDAFRDGLERFDLRVLGEPEAALLEVELEEDPEGLIAGFGASAEGEVLDLDPKSFGGIGIIGIREMGRFYRHVLVEKRFPHHTAVAFAPAGKTLWAALRVLGVEDISFNRPAGMLYPTENPF